MSEMNQLARRQEDLVLIVVDGVWITAPVHLKGVQWGRSSRCVLDSV